MVYKPDEFNGVKNWKINLHPDEDTIESIKEAGIQARLKDKPVEGVDGKFFTFRRPVEKVFGNRTTFFCPPIIIDRDGKEVVKYLDGGKKVFSNETGMCEMVGSEILIGNGSLVEVTLEVYPTKRFGNGTRLQSVKIIDLIEYVRPDEVGEEVVEVDETPFEPETPSKKVSW